MCPAQHKSSSSSGGSYPDLCKFDSKVKVTICISLRFKNTHEICKQIQRFTQTLLFLAFSASCKTAFI